MAYLYKLGGIVDHMVNNWSLREWMVFSVVMVLAGFLCMRGYGSRNNY